MTTLDGFTIPQGFRIRRADATVSGVTSVLDRFAQKRLTELETLLRRRIVPAGDEAYETLQRWLGAELTPPRAGGSATWEKDSLADILRRQGESSSESTLREVIDRHADLARTRYRFDESLDDRWSTLDFNTRTALGSASVRDLLVLRAAVVLGIQQQPALLNFVFTHPDGVASVVTYLQIGAARDHVEDRQLKVRGIEDRTGDAVTALRNAKLSLAQDALGPDAIRVATAFIEDSKLDKLIKLGTTKTIPPSIKPRLVQYIRESTVEVTEENAPFLVPMYLAKAATTSTTSSGVSGDDPFAVSFFVDDADTIQVSTAAVKCSAQLFYVMVLGEELGVFDAVRYFTHRYLFREGFAVEDPQLRRDLENYVFSEQFTGLDRETGEERVMRCTRDGERRSFYRQVFNQGSEPVPGDGSPNADFARLWKILMLESARYLERAQASPHPDNYVSRQNVMQAVEDLQYNLSVTCVGMATVMTPLMYAELDFVVNRILAHPEVRKHLVPSGGSWWKVVEKLQAAQGRRGRASVLFNKARLGYALIRAIADYTPSRFEQDDPFAEFISNVDAFITTQSILQEDAADAHGSDAEDSAEDRDATGGEDGYGGGASGGAGLPGMPDLSKLPGMPSIPGVSAPWPAGGNGSANGTGASGGGPAWAGAGAGGSGGSGGAGGSGDEWDF